MRQMISGLVAAAAVMTVSAAPASACGGLGLFNSCSPCGQAYVSPCAQSYAPVAPLLNFASGCGGCGGVLRAPKSRSVGSLHRIARNAAAG